MTYDDFKTLLESRKGASFITFTAITEPNWKALKETGPNPYKGKVRKRCKINGVINWAYETAVNKQRVREGSEPDFDALPRAWGIRVHGTPWVTHKEKTYLELKCQNVYEVEYLDENGDVLPDTDVLDADLNVVKHSVYFYVKPSAGNDRQQLDREVILRDYTLENIKEFTWNGVTDTLAA
jgi:hypothetical protein